MAGSSFFEQSREQSLVKAEIVAKYFWAWAKVMSPRAKKMKKKIAYIDLFAGPGRYKDGSKSTPFMKEIMAKESSSTEQGVPSFEYSQATKYQPLLYQY